MTDDPKALTQAILSDLRQGAWQSAVERADELLKGHPREPVALHAKALALHRLGRTAEALGPIDECLGLDPNASSWVLKGDILSDRGEYAGAKESFEAALKADAESKGASARLKTLAFYRDREDSPAAFFRLGWLVQFLKLWARMQALDQGGRERLLEAAAEIDNELKAVSGEGLAHFAGEDPLAEWRRILKAGDIEAFETVRKDVPDAILQEARGSFPIPASRWMSWGYFLNHAQFVYMSGAEMLKEGDSEGLTRVDGYVRELIGEMKGDAEFLRRVPGMGELVAEISKSADADISPEKCEALERGIEKIVTKLIR